jgi:hypothetical protein
LTIHSSSETPIPSSWRIDGSATFTTVLSIMIMNNPNVTAASVHHRRFSSVNNSALIHRRPLVVLLSTAPRLHDPGGWMRRR